MSKDLFYKKQTNINFTVKNVSPQVKTVTIFGHPIPYNGTKNLLDIADINEADIRDSFIKGELGYKLNNVGVTGSGGGGGIIFNLNRYREGTGVIIAPGGTGGSAVGSGRVCAK